MPLAIVLSSYVASGSVGLRAAHAVFERTATRLIAVPTVLLPAHLGHAGVTVHPLPVETFARLLDGLAAQIDGERRVGVLTGFMPSAEHAEQAAAWVERLRSTPSDVTVLVDPIMGDDPEGLYVAPAVAAAVAGCLLPLADIVTPNRFELERLSGMPVTDEKSAETAAKSLARPVVIATSIPAPDATLATVACVGGLCHSVRHPILKSRAHGTGDLFAALVLRDVLAGRDVVVAIRAAADLVHARLVATGSDHDIDLAGLA